MQIKRAVAAAACMLAAVQAWAHHSAAGYNTAVTLTRPGTLVEFDWSAPHAVVVFTYLDESGKPVEVAATAGSPAMISRQGFKLEDFSTGARVEMTWNPNRSGAPGGLLVSLKLADGRTLQGDAFGSPPGVGAGSPPK